MKYNYTRKNWADLSVIINNFILTKGTRNKAKDKLQTKGNSVQVIEHIKDTYSA